MSELYDAIIEELRALRELRPPWLLGTPYDDPDIALDPLDRRERERLARLGRGGRQAWRESTRERVARERTAPWRSEESWGIHKRLWRERRDQERDLLDVRESAILQGEADLHRWLPLYQRRLRELELLEPHAASWCRAMVRDAADLPSVADLSALWERYRAACAHYAAGLMAHTALHQRLAALRHTDDTSVRQQLALLTAGGIPPVAGLFAALIEGSDED